MYGIHYMLRVRICTRFRSQGNDSKESIPPAYIAWQGRYDKQGFRTGQPGWESIAGLRKRFTNTGSGHICTSCFYEGSLTSVVKNYSWSVPSFQATYIGWRYRFLGINFWAAKTFTNSGSVLVGSSVVTALGDLCKYWSHCRNLFSSDWFTCPQCNSVVFPTPSFLSSDWFPSIFLCSVWLSKYTKCTQF